MHEPSVTTTRMQQCHPTHAYLHELVRRRAELRQGIGKLLLVDATHVWHMHLTPLVHIRLACCGNGERGEGEWKVSGEKWVVRVGWKHVLFRC